METPLTDSDAWKNDISTIVRQKKQAKSDAVKAKQDREDSYTRAYEHVRALVKGEPTEAFEEFGSHLSAEGETAKLKSGPEDKNGPWVGIEVADVDGKFLDIRLQARVGVTTPRWFWIYAYGDRGNRNEQEEEVQSGDAGPSRQYVIQTLAEHYKTASLKHR